MNKKQCLIIILLFFVICIQGGCGFRSYSTIIPSHVSREIGRVDIYFSPMIHTGYTEAKYSFIDFNNLDFSTNGYYEFHVSLNEDESVDNIAYKLLVKSINISFPDSTNSYTFDWIYNSTTYKKEYGHKYSTIIIAPIHLPVKYKKEIAVSFNLFIYELNSDKLIEKIPISFTTKSGNSFWTIFSQNAPMH